MNTLRDALSQSQDIQDNLDSLLRWLAKVEGEFSQLENTVVVAKREPMEECCNRQKVTLLEILIAIKSKIDRCGRVDCRATL